MRTCQKSQRSEMSEASALTAMASTSTRYGKISWIPVWYMSYWTVHTHTHTEQPKASDLFMRRNFSYSCFITSIIISKNSGVVPAQKKSPVRNLKRCVCACVFPALTLNGGGEKKILSCHGTKGSSHISIVWVFFFGAKKAPNFNFSFFCKWLCVFFFWIILERGNVRMYASVWMQGAVG